ncbi:hypothetical protein N7533_008041 [Penicillium manginii]|uniref:uncharacterized protein n=1 Tax=Penicillium manginii TaxID=203109 RepID=UPI0025491856|nr:uncharacterized protein N7533_008041 [Penicillium manginii]KAJ5751013.1 hypothetical protein N7533_008041 [Penicillium manginii]
MRLPYYLFIGTAGLLASVDATSIPRSSEHTSGSTSSLIATQFGTVFDTSMVIGNQTFQMLVDTGSSDTYVMRNGFDCINATSNLVIPEADCLYKNKTYHNSRTHRHIPGQMFGIQYGAGLASGEMAYEDVTLSGITVKGQKIGIANISNPMGDGVNSGLLGLAYPSITSAHPANHSSNETYWFDRLPYNPLVYTMYEKGLIDPYFSLALAHTPQNSSTAFGGYLTIGGLPPVNHSSEFTTVPVEILKDIPTSFTSGKRARSYWATTIREVKYGSSSESLTTNSTSFQVFIDSGNYIQYLPSGVVEPINALFDPPAKYNADYGAYVVDCSAKAPQFGFTLGNQTFFHNGEDLIYQTGEGFCITNIASSEAVSLAGGITLNVIGVPFLKNVVAVHDFGKNEMRFAKLLDSNSTTSGTAAAGSGTPASSLGSKSVERVSWVQVAMAAGAGLSFIF